MLLYTHRTKRLARAMTMTTNEITTVNYYGYNVKVEITGRRPHTINWNNEVLSIRFLEAVKMHAGTRVEEVKPIGYTTQLEVAY